MRELGEMAQQGAGVLLATVEQWQQQHGQQQGSSEAQATQTPHPGSHPAPGMLDAAASGVFGLFQNSPLWIAVACFAVAQLLKFLINYYQTQSWQYERLVGSGGMPSAHSAFVTGLATSVAIRDGSSSSTFAIAIVFALVVMYDATNLRMACGRHAQALNALMADLPSDHPAAPAQFGTLKEQLGHTHLQVAAGATLGFLLALLIQGLLGPAP